MPVYTLQGPDGRTYEIEGPQGATADQLAAFVQSQQPPQPAQQKEEKSGVMQTLGNVLGGAVRGAGSIGSTLYEATPIGTAQRMLQGKGFMQSRNERVQGIDDAWRGMGAETDSLGYGAGKIGAEIAGTAGAGGVLSKIAQAGKAAPALIEALRTGGLSGGNLATRLGAGAATGATAAGMVNPEEAGRGAAVGSAIPGVAQAAKVLPKIAGATTGVGEEALKQAFVSGAQGGAKGKAFAEAMRGQSSMDDVLSSAKQAITKMGQDKQAAYRSGMANVKNDKTVLSFNDIDSAINDAMSLATYKGQVKNPEAAKAVQEISNRVQQWRNLDPAQFHTPEGVDALKQSISGVIESLPFEQKTARLAAGKIYDSVKQTISKQAPEYSKVMKDYSEASDLINEVQKGLIGGNKATADTSLRKLQSLMRNNVNTSYGYRGELAKQLEQAGGQDIMAPLAGQALNEWTPRGIQRATAGTGTVGLAYLGNPIAAAGMAATSSPRLMGEALYGAGKLSNSRLAELLRASAPVIAAQ